MLREVDNPPDIDDIPSPLSAEIFELCGPELFQEALQYSEVNTNSNRNCSYEENISYTTNISFAPNQNNFPNNNLETYATKTNTTTPTAATTNDNISISTNFPTIFDTPEEIENDISTSIDFSQPTQFSLPQFPINQQDQFDLSSFQPQVPLPNINVVNGLSNYPQIGPPLPSVFEEECLTLIPSYGRLNANSSPSCSFLEPQTGPYLPSNLSTTLSADNSGIFNGNLFMGNEFQPQELEFQGDNGGIFCPDQLPRIYNSSEVQGLSNESQVHVMNGAGSSATPLGSEVSSLEESALKAAKLSAEERKEKIHRYMKKRGERNFSKKIKYACRKTLADSRPRVRGRFAKNDELGEMTRGGCSNHEEDTDEEVSSRGLMRATSIHSQHVVVKEEEEEMVDSSDIFAHISGLCFNRRYANPRFELLGHRDF